jgi:hypothetical protein
VQAIGKAAKRFPIHLPGPFRGHVLSYLHNVFTYTANHVKKIDLNHSALVFGGASGLLAVYAFGDGYMAQASAVRVAPYDNNEADAAAAVMPVLSIAAALSLPVRNSF